MSLFGICKILGDMKVPLVWVDIASAGMSKGDAVKRIKKNKLRINLLSLSFCFTFFPATFLINQGVGGLVAMLYLLLMSGISWLAAGSKFCSSSKRCTWFLLALKARMFYLAGH